MGTPIDELLEQLRYGWGDDGMEDDARKIVAAMTAELDAAAIAALVEEGDAYPADGVEEPEATHVSFHLNPGFRFHALVDIVAKRRPPAAVPVLRALLSHASDQARTAAERALVEIGDPASLVDVGARVAESVDPAAIETWIELRLRDEPAAAYTAITDRIAHASTEAAQAIRDIALRIVATAASLDPRWADVAAEHLANWRAIPVLVRLRDRRVIPTLVADLENPGYGAVLGALEKLKLIVDTDELLAIATPFYEHAYYPGAFEQVLGTAASALVARRKEKREAELRAQSHPFLFFGAAPGDWYEGANLGHLYIVGFANALDANRRQLARVRFRPGVEVEDKWRWGDLDGRSWAQFCVGGSQPFDSMARGLIALHAIEPIREVIFGGQREESRTDDWTAWSRLQGTAAKRVPKLDPRTALDMIHFFAGREVVPADVSTSAAKTKKTKPVAKKPAAKKPAAKKPAAKKPAAKKPAAKKPAKKKPAAKKR